MLRIFEKIVDNYKVDPGKLDSLVLRKGLIQFEQRKDEQIKWGIVHGKTRKKRKRGQNKKKNRNTDDRIEGSAGCS